MSGGETRKIERAMVLAAGRGKRMRELTDGLPKPLVEVQGRAMIDHVLDRLADAGVTRAVVNHSYLGDRIVAHLAARQAPDRSEPGSSIASTMSSVSRARDRRR